MSVSVEDYRPDTMTERPEPAARPAKKGEQARPEAQAEEAFQPVRVWTAGPGMPQEDIYTTGLYGRLRPYLDGAYYCQTPEEVTIAKRALGPRFWVDNTDEDLTCSTCNWKCRNTRAFEAHLNNAHGRPQAV